VSNHAKAGIAAGVLAIGMYLVIRFVLPLFTPFIVALFIAILIDPVVSFLERRLRLPRAVAVIIVLVALGVILSLLVAVGVSEISREVDQLSRNIGGLSKSLARVVDDVTRSAARFFEGLPQPVTDIIRANEGRIVALVEAAASGMAVFLRSLPQFTLTLLISIVATFFVSRDFYSASARAASALPRAWRKQFGKIRGEMLAAFVGFFEGPVRPPVDHCCHDYPGPFGDAGELRVASWVDMRGAGHTSAGGPVGPVSALGTIPYTGGERRIRVGLGFRACAEFRCEAGRRSQGDGQES